MGVTAGDNQVPLTGQVSDCNGRLDTLSAAELAVVQAALQGNEANSNDTDLDALTSTNDTKYVVRAKVLRDLLLGLHGRLHPRGIQLVGYRISEELDLYYCECVAAIRIENCVFAEAINLKYSHLPALTIENSRVQSIHADGLRIDGDLFLTNGFRATGRGDEEAIRLLWAHVGGQLSMNAAQIESESATALHGDGLRVDGDMFLTQEFSAISDGEEATVRLVGANIGGQLCIGPAELESTSGAALQADSIQIGQDLLLKRGSFQSSSRDPTIQLSRAYVGARISLLDTKINNACEDQPAGAPVLTLEQTETSSVELKIGTFCGSESAKEKGSKAKPCGPPLKQVYTVNLAGFQYRAYSYTTWRELLHLIRCHASKYSATPYQHLAAVERESGHEDNARAILISQQDALRKSGGLEGWFSRRLHGLWGLLAGYGYRTRRTALFLVMLLALSGTLGLVAGQWWPAGGSHVVAEDPASYSKDVGQECSSIELVGLGLDRGLPFLRSGLQDRCDVNTEVGGGQVVTALFWIIEILVWALAALMIAGFTGLVRRSA